MGKKVSSRSGLFATRTRGSTRTTDHSTVIQTVGKGRRYSIASYEIDPHDIEDMLQGRRHAPRPPVRATYYKPTRAQHYAAMGALYGVHRKPGQSERAYGRAVQKAIDAAQQDSSKDGGALTPEDQSSE